MNTSIFTQKLLRQRGFLASLISLLALFVGLGASLTAEAQSYNSDNITISASPSGGIATSTKYDGSRDKAPYNPLFNGAILGNGSLFDQATGSLTITAASANLSTSSSKPFTESLLLYRVYLSGTTPPANLSKITFDLLSADNNSNDVTFGVSNVAIDLLHHPAVLGGGTYVVEIFYQSTYTKNIANVDEPYQIIDPGAVNIGYRATFKVLTPLVTPSGGTSMWISTGVIAGQPVASGWGRQW
ncbi:hypothetical protein ACFQT0_05810 [Hymenobacter humi]|uniref:Uncharacterized protein n=1 Tax=Hymenobacter humi TaxID=1411620 RepID=A0ABW2U224_9BACT